MKSLQQYWVAHAQSPAQSITSVMKTAQPWFGKERKRGQNQAIGLADFGKTSYPFEYQLLYVVDI